jgi:hypothetical protein
MDKEKLLEFFAEFWNIKKSELKEGIRLSSEDIESFSSVRFYQFIAAIESNFDVKVNNINKINTLFDLLNNVGGSSTKHENRN